MSEFTEQHIVAVDLGTSKIALIVAKIYGDDVQVVYYKETASAGIQYSGVSNMVQACTPLTHLVKDAEEALNIKINHAVIGMPKWPIRQESNSGKIMDRGDYTEIMQEDVDNLKRFAQETYPLQSVEREAIYGAVAQSFSDGESFQIKEADIVGMSSDVLEGHFKIFIGKRKELMNADSLLAKAGLSAVKKYFNADATAQVVLNETEMENGVALVDIGGGSTSVTIYHDSIMRHYASIPFGGRNVTQDIKSELQITERLAENIKLAFGACIPEKLQNMSEKVLRIVDNNTDQDKQVPVKYLSEIITARMEEIIEAVLYEIKESGLAEHLRCGIVITGGAAQTANLGMLINEMSGYKVRIGYPRKDVSEYDVDGTHETSASSALGLLMAALRDNMVSCAVDMYEPESRPIEVETDKEEGSLEEVEIMEDTKKDVDVEAEVEVEVEEEVKEEEVVKEKERKPKEEKPKEEKWKFLKVLWGKAQSIGEELNKYVDGITDSDDEDNNE